MGNERDGVSISERWATSQATRSEPSSVIFLLGLLALLIFLVVRTSSATFGPVWVLLPVWITLALAEWERIGFRRLLARRDAEIERLRSGDESA